VCDRKNRGGRDSVILLESEIVAFVQRPTLILVNEPAIGVWLDGRCELVGEETDIV
jgi:hypothetical protein